MLGIMTELLAKIVDQQKLSYGDAEGSGSAKANAAEMAATRCGKSPDPKRNIADTMRDQIETWVNEGGAGDDVRS